MTKIPYVEWLRRSGMKTGNCELCGRFTDALEFHHESYRPERGLYLCHNCHHKVHWYSYLLTPIQKKRLLTIRLKNTAGIDEAKLQKEMKLYKPPRKTRRRFLVSGVIDS